MKNELELKPTYWASVSGGKDSLLMFQMIVKNPDKYPLNGVFHVELEIDYPFIKNVINEIKSTCDRLNIPFISIRPSRSWYDMLEQWGFPDRKARWCNSAYKKEGSDKLEKQLKTQGYQMKRYIGYCVDEVKRYENRKAPNEIYPLVLENINEDDVLMWAGKQPIFNDYYKVCRRCGCMYCPMLSLLEMAYILKYYPVNYEFMITAIRDREQQMSEKLGRPWALKYSNPKYNADYVDNIVRTKWLAKLEEKENEQ